MPTQANGGLPDEDETCGDSHAKKAAEVTWKATTPSSYFFPEGVFRWVKPKKTIKRRIWTPRAWPNHVAVKTNHGWLLLQEKVIEHEYGSVRSREKWIFIRPEDLIEVEVK